MRRNFINLEKTNFLIVFGFLNKVFSIDLDLLCYAGLINSTSNFIYKTELEVIQTILVTFCRNLSSLIVSIFLFLFPGDFAYDLDSVRNISIFFLFNLVYVFLPYLLFLSLSRKRKRKRWAFNTFEHVGWLFLNLFTNSLGVVCVLEPSDHQAGAYPSFCSITCKRLTFFHSSLDGNMLVHSRPP